MHFRIGFSKRLVGWAPVPAAAAAASFSGSLEWMMVSPCQPFGDRLLRLGKSDDFIGPKILVMGVIFISSNE